MSTLILDFDELRALGAEALRRTWTGLLHVHARIQINGVTFAVTKCDTAKATLEPLELVESGIPWTMRVRTGEPFLLPGCNQWLKVLSVHLKNEMELDGHILVAPTRLPPDKERQRWEQSAFDFDFFAEPDEEEDDV